MLNFTGIAPHQQQHAFQSMPNQVTSTQYIEKGRLQTTVKADGMEHWSQTCQVNLIFLWHHLILSLSCQRASHFHHTLHLKTFLVERYTTNSKVPDMSSIFSAVFQN